MYTVISVILTAGMILVTLWGAKCRTVCEMKKVLYINLIAAGIGALAMILTPVLTHLAIYGTGKTEEWKEWAWDAFVLFLKTSLPFCLIAAALISASVFVMTFVQKKGQVFSAVVRQAAAVASSVVLLMMSPFYSVMAETEGAKVHIAILLFGLAEALFLRLVFVCETAVRLGKAKKNTDAH